MGTGTPRAMVLGVTWGRPGRPSGPICARRATLDDAAMDKIKRVEAHLVVG
jgi:hypothetical protein